MKFHKKHQAIAWCTESLLRGSLRMQFKDPKRYLRLNRQRAIINAIKPTFDPLPFEEDPLIFSGGSGKGDFRKTRLSFIERSLAAFFLPIVDDFRGLI
jgi:hypothetical protein